MWKDGESADILLYNRLTDCWFLHLGISSFLLLADDLVRLTKMCMEEFLFLL